MLSRKRLADPQEFQRCPSKHSSLGGFAQVAQRINEFARLRFSQRERIIGPKRHPFGPKPFHEKIQHVRIMDQRIDVELAKIMLRPARIVHST